MAHSKNPPTLYDNFMAHPFYAMHKTTPKGVLDELLNPLKQAHVYVLDEEASAFFGYLLKGNAPLILRQHEFARAPFPNTWIEFEFPPYMKTLDGRDASEDGDKRVGFFINARNSMFTVSETEKHRPMMSPYFYLLHQPVSFEEELAMAQKLATSRLGLRQVILGDSGLDGRWFTEADAANVCRSHKLVIADHFESVPGNLMFSLLRHGAGSLKQCLCLLLLLTRPGQAVLTLHEQNRRQGIIRGKPKVLTSHHKVTLHLQRDMAVKKVVEALHETGRHNRYHDVRGHWCQSRKRGMHCDHVWEPTSVNRYECLKGCGAKRWWKSDHHRGDLSLGAVTKTYEVTK